MYMIYYGQVIEFENLSFETNFLHKYEIKSCNPSPSIYIKFAELRNKNQLDMILIIQNKLLSRCNIQTMRHPSNDFFGPASWCIKCKTI